MSSIAVPYTEARSVEPRPLRLTLREDGRRTPGLKVFRGLGWVVLVIASIILSVLLHLSTSLGRAAVADGAGLALSSRIRGTARIGSVSRLDFDGIEMREVTITSPSGTRVIDARRWEADFAFATSLERGALVMAPSVLDGGTMRLSPGPGDRIDLVYAMEVPADRFMIPVEVRDISLRDLTIAFSLPLTDALSLPSPLQMADVSGLIDMELGHTFHCRMDGLRGFVNIPVVHVGFSSLSGRIASDVAIPLVIRMVLDLEVADPSMEVRYVAPATVGGEGAGHMDVTLGVDVPPIGG